MKGGASLKGLMSSLVGGQSLASYSEGLDESLVIGVMVSISSDVGLTEEYKYTGHHMPSFINLADFLSRFTKPTSSLCLPGPGWPISAAFNKKFRIVQCGLRSVLL